MWLAWAFATAVLTSAGDVVAKTLSGKVSPYVTAWAWTFFSLPILLVFLIWEGPVTIEPSFWPSLAASTLILSVGSVLMFKSIEACDLSLSVPILSFTPLFLLVTSPIMLGEFPKIAGIGGIVLIVAGSYALYYDPDRQHPLAPLKRMLTGRGSRYMLIVAFLFSIGGNVDKIGTQSSSPLVWSLSFNACVSVVLGVLMFHKVPDALKQIRRRVFAFFLLGSFLGGMMMVQMTAITMTQVPYVIAVKRTSIVISSLMGFLIFKERAGKRRLLAVILMVAGVFMISFG